jgi:hypothetical protein
MKTEIMLNDENHEIEISENDIIVNDKLGEAIIKTVSKKLSDHTVKNEKTSSIKKYKFLDFKGVKSLTFKKFKTDYPDFKWGYIQDLFKDLNAEEANFVASFTSESIWFFYNKLNKRMPVSYYVDKKKYNKKFVADFFNLLDPPTFTTKISHKFNEHDLKLQETVVMIEKDLVMFYDDDLYFYINPDVHLVESDSNPFYLLMRLLNKYKSNTIEKNKIHIVYKSEYGFSKLAFNVKHINVDINANYNDDFKPISEEIIKNLNSKNKSGLYILNGEPGTGKTTYIRYLAGKIKRNIIFISPDMVEYITDPSFILFLMDNSDSVLIIEDAEPALQKRDGSTRTGAISNILNLTDGLLSDCLNISIVATFNTNTKNLDEALLREGRLINSYMFENLSIEKSCNLLKTLGNNVNVTKPMKLSEIYFYGKDNKNKLFKHKTIGF